MTQMKRIALSGGMGSGKSHVRAVFAALGVPTIDADTLARDVVAHGTPGFDAVVAKFGRGILNADGDLDRRALGALGVRRSGQAARPRGHPAPRHQGRHRPVVHHVGSVGAAVRDCRHPLLYEVKLDKEYDAVIVTACTRENQGAAHHGARQPRRQRGAGDGSTRRCRSRRR
jgi:dephospho-CoA kinase